MPSRKMLTINFIQRSEYYHCVSNIHLSIHFLLPWGCWSQSQLPLGKKQVHHGQVYLQYIAVLTQKNLLYQTFA